MTPIAGPEADPPTASDRGPRSHLLRRARQTRICGQLRGWSEDRIVDEILRRQPGLSHLEAHRLARGWTREQLSEAIDHAYAESGARSPHISSSDIGGWEHGRHWPNAQRRDVLARVYRTRPDRLGFGADHSATGSPGSGAGAPSPTSALPIPSRLGADLVTPSDLGDLAERWPDGGRGLADCLNAVTTGYARRCQEAGPGAALGPGRMHLAYLLRALRSTRGPLSRELARAAGETAVLVGWQCLLTHNLPQAKAHFGLARQIAAEAGDLTVGTYSLVAESTVHIPTVNAGLTRARRSGLGLLEAARSGARRLPPPLQAWLAAKEAELYGFLRRPRAAARAVESLQAATAQTGDHWERAWCFHPFTEAKALGIEGLARLGLGDAGSGAALEAALVGIEFRSSSFGLRLQVALAAARITEKEVDEAARLLGDAFRGLLDTDNTLLAEQVQRQRARIGASAQPPAVRRLDDLLAAAAAGAVPAPPIGQPA